VVTHSSNDEWVFLLHRLPREPSAPRIALWRALRRLGALLLSDGLVALPATARTIEHLEWLAAGIEEHSGSASVWVARPSSRVAGERLAAQSRDATEAEYRAVMRDAEASTGSDRAEMRRTLRRLRAELRRIASRDFFSAPGAAASRAAVERLATESTNVPA
jgi:hypothetical protein